jgi:glycosyltransferase involved in cell wall biosynthesis
MHLLAISTLFTLLTTIPFFFVIVNSLTMREIKGQCAQEINLPISILIPMRNEERNVSEVIAAVTTQEQISNNEIIVLDDNSTDSTKELLARYTNIRVLDGAELPQGWLGKNYACHQLVAHSSGELLVFLDADVRIAPQAIAAAIVSMESWGWDFISPYPRQDATTFVERLIQPLLQWSWLSSVPLRFAENTQFTSMVIANGQFFIVRKDAYLSSGGHKEIRSEVLDDLELARLLVKNGFKGGVANGSSIAQCRMYNSASELADGYTKSLWRAFGGVAGTIVVALYLTLTGIAPLVLALSGFPIAWLGYFLIVGSRLIAGVKVKSTLSSALLHPLSIVVLLLLTIRSWIFKSRGTLTWRGRKVA